MMFSLLGHVLGRDAYSEYDQNCVRVQCHWKVYTDEEKNFDAITGLTYVPDYVCDPERQAVHIRE